MNTTKKIALTALTSLLVVSPLLAFAQVQTSPPGVFSVSLADLGNKLVTQVWVVFTVIAIIAFVVAGVLFLTSGGDPEKVGTARRAFIWGIAGIVAGIVAYTIIAVVRGGLGA